MKMRNGEDDVLGGLVVSLEQTTDPHDRLAQAVATLTTTETALAHVRAIRDETLLTLADAGVPTTDLARTCGITDAAVRHIVATQRRRTGTTPPRPTDQLTADYLHRRYTVERASIAQIAADVGVTPSTVASYLDRHSIERRGRGRTTPRPSRDELNKLYREGATLQQLADRYRVTSTTVARWCDEHGIERRPRSVPRPRPSRDELSQLYHDEGATLDQLADRYGVTSTTVGRWCDEYGIERRPRGTRR